MRALSLIVACVLLSACASTQNVALSPDMLQTMQGKSLVLIQRESPDFVAMTSGKGMFAVAGVGAAVAAGNKMVRENDIVDPAMGISRVLAKGLVGDYGLTLLGETDKAESDDIADLAQMAGSGDYALDVVTNGWTYMYDGFNFGDYFVGYSSKLRMIDVRTARVVSSGFCAYDAKKAGKSPVSHESLLADNAAYIKQELTDAADLCVREFAANLFSVHSLARSTR